MPCDGPGCTNVNSAIALGEKKLGPTNAGRTNVLEDVEGGRAASIQAIHDAVTDEMQGSQVHYSCTG